MTTTVEDIDRLIAAALNEPLGQESPPAWEDVTRHGRNRPATRGANLNILRWLKHSTLARLATVAIVAVLIAVVVLVLPGKRTSLLAAAAAALPGNGPVVHLVYDVPAITLTTLNVKTGRLERRSVRAQDELWYDAKLGLFKEIRRYPLLGFAASDIEWRSRNEAFSNVFGRQSLSGTTPGQAVDIQVPPEARLFSRYKQALQERQLELNGTGRIDDHTVLFLWYYHCDLIPFPGHPGSSLGCGAGTQSETIAIDSETYRPIAVFDGTDTSGAGLRIRSVELVSRTAANLSKPKRTPYPPALTPGPANCPCADLAARATRKIEPSAAQAWLGRQPVGPSTSLAGLPFMAAHADLLNPAGTRTRRGLQLLYGSSCNGLPRYGGTYILVSEAATPEMFYDTAQLGLPRSTVPLLKGYSHYAECDAPTIGFYSGQPREERIWVTVLHTHGLYVSISSTREQLAVIATQRLAR